MVTATTRRGRDLNVVLQIFDRDIEQILEAARLIRHDLIARTNAPAAEYRPIELAAPAKKRAAKKRRTSTRSVPAARAKKNGHTTTRKKRVTKKKSKKS
jgi:hypothetical protein